jgi:flagellar basal-body rod modification protein FlgD
MTTAPVSNNTNGTVYGIDTIYADAKKQSAPNEIDKEAFLKLLVAQLKYQDPMKPTDAESFMAQTAQFTQVEKLDEISTALTAAATSSGLSTASSLLGKQVTFAKADGTTDTGVVTSVKSGAGGVTLEIGNRETTLDKVTQISNPSTTPSGSGSTTG